MKSLLRQLKEEKLRRLKLPRLSPTEILFPEQLKAFDDKAMLKAYLCTRRAGKSYALGAEMLVTANAKPKSLIPYIALTRQSAENIMLPVLRELNDKYNLGCEILDSSLEVITPNGSKIFLVGADTKNFIGKLRGPKYPKAFIDEVQSFREHVGDLVDDVLLPAVADYQGSVVLAGTPGPVPRGYFFNATSKDQTTFSVHRWSVFNNPHLPNMREFVDKLMKLKGWTEDNPTYRREWLGQWVEDLDALFYKFRPVKNEYTGETPQGVRNILGIDLGWNDQCAFGIVSYHPNSPKVWVPHVEGHSQMIPTDIALRTKQLIEKWRPSKIVVDTGGLGKSIAEEMIRRYGIPALPAQKTEKLTYVRLLNGEFIDGNMLIHESLTELKDQYLKLEKDSDGYEVDGISNDLCDCILYAYREARSYAFTPELSKPKDSAEKFSRQESEWLKQEELKGLKKSKREWWEDDQ